MTQKCSSFRHDVAAMFCCGLGCLLRQALRVPLLAWRSVMAIDVHSALSAEQVVNRRSRMVLARSSPH